MQIAPREEDTLKESDVEYDLGEEVELLKDLTAFKAAFARFEGCEVNGWSAEKEAGLGAVGIVIEVYPNSTVALELVRTGGSQFFCPAEAIEQKTGGFDVRFEWARTQYVQGQRVRLVSDPQAFREAFYRFDGDPDGNDWSEYKQEYMGAEGAVVAIYDDKSLTLEFDGGDELDFPYEAIDMDPDPDDPDPEGSTCLPCGTNNDLDTWNKLSAEAFTYVWNKRI